MLNLSALNEMPEERFVDLLGHIAEDSPFIALAAAQDRPFADHASLVTAFENALRKADGESQLAVLRAHPDLAGKLTLTDASLREQKGAGLDQLTKAERDKFMSHNRSYRERFDFPFIYAVKGATKEQILSAFEQRLIRDFGTERDEAIGQVVTIMRWRLIEAVAA
ncbi:MAG: 2-oxo-4-hydroxy-4-carboxy-5-ureidoimidazoline decarboxylase [Pseudomonadota bacterium]